MAEPVHYILGGRKIPLVLCGFEVVVGTCGTQEEDGVTCKACAERLAQITQEVEDAVAQDAG